MDTAKWEYLTLQSSANYGTTKFYVNGEMQPALKNQPLATVMNQIGGQGWEMVGVATDKDGHTYIFKRPATRAAELVKQKPSA
jgi:hypothetical protein